MLSANVRELVLERVDGAPFVFQAGQWLNLVLPLAAGEARRAYSIASPPDGTPRLELAVTRVEGGAGSAFLHDLAEGTELRAIGPQGFFTRAPNAGHASLFIGTGTGVTPLRSMIKDALANGESAPLLLLAGMRTEADRLYHEELGALSAAHPHFRAIYTLSRPSGAWSGRTGYVQTHVEEAWHELLAHSPPHAYVCGLERMVGSVRELLRKHMGVDRKHVHTERYD
jgi:CDP-4-dehydro-6-deoxyglucose reductase, E3